MSATLTPDAATPERDDWREKFVRAVHRHAGTVILSGGRE